MAQTTASESTDDSLTSTEKRQAAIARVLNLSIFLVGAGVFAAGGLAMVQTDLLAAYQTTYFSVGAALGVVGLLLWLLTR